MATKPPTRYLLWIRSHWTHKNTEWLHGRLWISVSAKKTHLPLFHTEMEQFCWSISTLMLSMPCPTARPADCLSWHGNSCRQWRKPLNFCGWLGIYSYTFGLWEIELPWKFTSFDYTRNWFQMVPLCPVGRAADCQLRSPESHQRSCTVQEPQKSSRNSGQKSDGCWWHLLKCASF